MRSQRAFTLVELLFVVVVVGALLTVQAVAVASSLDQSSVRSDIADLRLMSQASALYADVYDDRLFTFSWRAGEVPSTPNAELAAACANLSQSGGDVLRASAIQQLDLVVRNTEFKQLIPQPGFDSPSHTPYAQYNHLILAHFMGAGLPSEVLISDGDAARTYWNKDVDAYLDNPDGSRFRPPSARTGFLELWRWPFSSSYVTGPSHYSPDTEFDDGIFRNQRTVERGNTHRLWSFPSRIGMYGNRDTSEIAYPAQKVMLFDEFDRYTGPHGQFFGFEDSRSVMVFYDGSAGRFATSAAAYGFNPNDPDRGADTPDQPSDTYFYSPISWWDPPGSVGTIVPVRYDQTRDGLRGIDYQRGSVRRPVRSR